MNIQEQKLHLSLSIEVGQINQILALADNPIITSQEDLDKYKDLTMDGSFILKQMADADQDKVSSMCAVAAPFLMAMGKREDELEEQE
jgi:hypothetical protein